jgi:thiamine kinase-like enzyme
MIVTPEATLPPEVAESFYPKGLDKIQLLGGGMINATYLTIDQEGNKAITQRLHEIFDPVLMEDLVVVTQHMREDDLEAPSIVKTVTGDLFATDQEGKVWRSFTYIQNDPAPAHYDRETLVAMGGLLARLHRSFGKLDYIPRFRIPHFHETDYYAAQLEARIDMMPDEATSLVSRTILTEYQGVPELPDLGIQLIHADPRTQNMLFRDGKPFTFVDLDTVMEGSPWIDIGDFLRALTHDAVVADSPDLADNLTYAIDGYRLGAGSGMGRDEFHRSALAAARLITLELGMRFMADIVNDNYFEWDQQRFPSRQANHMSQVGRQLVVHQALLAAERGDK